MRSTVRLVEVLGSLSLAADAADGFPAETTMRSAVLAAGLAQRVGHPAVGDVLIGGLLRHIGCTGFAAEEAHVYGAGDDVALRAVMAEVDFGQPERAVRHVTENLAREAPPAERAAAVQAILGGGGAAGVLHDAAQCDAGERLAALIPVDSAARAVATDAFERWDGRGGPQGKQGDEISSVARLVEVGYVAELFRCRQGRGGAIAEVRQRSGGQLDPTFAGAFLDHPGELFDLNEDPHVSVWEALCGAEPEPWAQLSPSHLDAVALAFARFTDLKSVFFTGHSEAVADLAAQAAAVVGLDADAVTDIRRAGLLHDIGRVAIPTGTWDRPRALSGPERDRVRFHAWETQRILTSTPLLASLATLAGAAHERVDGSGYHRGLTADHLDVGARLIAAADVATALREARPHRPEMSEHDAHEVLRAEVVEGRLDHAAVSAVLAVRGAPALAPPSWPSRLTDREVDVLRAVAAGGSNKDVAQALGITAKTVAHHVAHIYDKTGCRSRAGLTLFALEHQLAGARSPRER